MTAVEMKATLDHLSITQGQLHFRNDSLSSRKDQLL